MACLCVALTTGAAPAEPAPHPWGVDKFLAEYGMWNGCKKGSKVRHRIEITGVGARGLTTSAMERERKLFKVDDDAYTFEVRERDIDKRGKPGRWKPERTTGSRAFEKKETVALGKTTYRLGRTRVPVKRFRVKTAKGTLEEKTEYLVHEEYGVVHAITRSEYATSEWRLVRLTAECKVGKKALACREYEYEWHDFGTDRKSEKRLHLNPKVPGYVVRAAYSLGITKFVERLLSFSKKK